MRTTLTLEDHLAKELKRTAHESGKSFKEVVNETLQAGLNAQSAPSAKRYRLKASSLGAVRPGVQLDKALQLADKLEDEALMEKLERRK